METAKLFSLDKCMCTMVVTDCTETPHLCSLLVKLESSGAIQPLEVHPATEHHTHTIHDELRLQVNLTHTQP